MKETGVVNLKGKQYKTVALRVSEFRGDHPLWSLVTEVLERTEADVVMVAKVLDESGRILATGHAEENRKASQVNRTSALENCETSAIGRALAALGYGGSEFASADELANAIHQQHQGMPKEPILPASGALDSLTPEMREAIVEAADKIIVLCDSGDYDEAVHFLERAAEDWSLEATEKVALWSLLPSHHRSAIKKLQKGQS